MGHVSPPPLPRFLEGALPGRRRAWRLEEGPDAGRVLHYLEVGPPSAPPVLLLHGNPTWCYLWRKVIRALPPQRFRCLAPDLLGLGLSSKLARPGDHQLDRHLAALRSWARALELERPALLVGQDWGGPLAAGVGLDLPAGAAGLVLANTSVLVPRRPRGTRFHRFSNTPCISDLAFRLLEFPQRGLARVQGDRRSIRGDVARAYRWPLRRLRDRAAPLGLARMVPARPDHPSLPTLRVIEAWACAFAGPVALVWGERDPILGRALDKHTAALPRATVTRTEAGHFLQEEVPGALAAAIVDVADRARGAARR